MENSSILIIFEYLKSENEGGDCRSHQLGPGGIGEGPGPGFGSGLGFGLGSGLGAGGSGEGPGPNST